MEVVKKKDVTCDDAISLANSALEAIQLLKKRLDTQLEEEQEEQNVIALEKLMPLEDEEIQVKQETTNHVKGKVVQPPFVAQKPKTQFQQRVEADISKKRERYAIEQTKALQNEMAALSAPSITAKSKLIPYNHEERTMKWMAAKEEKIRLAQRNLLEREQVRQHQGPEICKGTLKIVNSMPIRKYETVEERLYLAGKEMDSKKKKTQQQKKSENGKSARKRMELKRYDDVQEFGKRLYDDAVQRWLRIQQAQDRQLEMESVDANTGNKLFHPAITSFAARIERDDDVATRLLDKGYEYDMKKSHAVEMADYEAKVNCSRPKSAPRNRAPSRERNAVSRPRSASTLKGGSVSTESVCSFHPEVSETSQELARKVYGKDLTWDERQKLFEAWKDNREAINGQLRIEKRKSEMEECTFSPRKSAGKTSTGKFNVLEFAKRNTESVREREEKLSSMRRSVRRAELEECTFQPKTTTTTSSASSSLFSQHTQASASKLRNSRSAESCPRSKSVERQRSHSISEDQTGYAQLHNSRRSSSSLGYADLYASNFKPQSPNNRSISSSPCGSLSFLGYSSTSAYINSVPSPTLATALLAVAEKSNNSPFHH